MITPEERARQQIDRLLTAAGWAVRDFRAADRHAAARRGQLTLNVPFEQWLADLRSLPELRFEPVAAEIAALAGSFDGAMHGDAADRIVAATARTLGARLVTADERLRGLPDVVAIW